MSPAVRKELVVPAALAAWAVLAALLSLGGPVPLRAVVVGLFVAVVPGAAIALHLRGAGRAARACVAVAVSLSLAVLVSQVQVLLGAAGGTRFVVPLALVTLAAAGLAARRSTAGEVRA